MTTPSDKDLLDLMPTMEQLWAPSADGSMPPMGHLWVASATQIAYYRQKYGKNWQDHKDKVEAALREASGGEAFYRKMDAYMRNPRNKDKILEAAAEAAAVLGLGQLKQ